LTKLKTKNKQNNYIPASQVYHAPLSEGNNNNNIRDKSNEFLYNFILAQREIL